MERLTSGGLGDLLERVGPALTSGSANVISVAAIRAFTGGKWSRKRELVEEFVERAFARTSPDGGLVVALNDIEYLTIHADASRWTALNLSGAILRETLTFFLGKAERQDIRLLQVTGFSNGELAVEPVNPACLEGPGEAATSFGLSSRTDESLPPVTRLSGRKTQSIRLVAGGVGVDATHLTLPTWNVRDKVVTSFLVETMTSPEPTAELPPLLAAEVARSSLEFAAQQVRACVEAGAPVAMHVPVPLSALSMAAGRYPLLHLMRDLSPSVRRLLVVELTDVPDGVPQSRLSEAVSMLAPHARAVLARAPSEMANILQWRRCGLHGVTLDCRRIHTADRGTLARLSTFARNALALAPACVGYSLNTMSLMVSAWGAGFTHLSGPAISREVRSLAAVRLSPRDLYSQSRL
ncbi:MAG: hypothetical protein JWQ97_3092 [Phenylobacterium sp.]|nr:hypothetical protein [Phenylobacterium sp.]